MPSRPPTPCTYPGCRDMSTKHGRCDSHQRPARWNDKRAGERRARRMGSSKWERKRLWVLTRDKYLCQPCLNAGRHTEAREVDHIAPLAEGGTDADANLQSICVACHKDKTAAEAARARAGRG